MISGKAGFVEKADYYVTFIKTGGKVVRAYASATFTRDV